MPADHSQFDHQFRKLIELQGTDAGNDLLAELLRHGPAVSRPLQDYLVRQPHAPDLAVLVELLGKTMDGASTAVLLGYLNSGESALRRAAATALGWNRSRPALEILDRLEGEDPDISVRTEAQLAIEEILREYPDQRNILQHHRNPDGEGPRIDEATLREGEPTDRDQRLALMVHMPRLLAFRYQAMPLNVDTDGRLHMAVVRSGERLRIPLLGEIAGRTIELHHWEPDHLKLSMEMFYNLGDDDFCLFFDRMTTRAMDMVREMVLQGVRPNEPACPLADANDAIEAVQGLLSCCCAWDIGRAKVWMHEGEMTIALEKAGGESVMEMDPPPPPLRDRFMLALRALGGLTRHGMPGEETGSIRLVYTAPCRHAAVIVGRGAIGETILLEFTQVPP